MAAQVVISTGVLRKGLLKLLITDLSAKPAAASHLRFKLIALLSHCLRYGKRFQCVELSSLLSDSNDCLETCA